MMTLYDKLVATAKPWTAQRTYKANCSDIRAFGRFSKSPEERIKKIAQACRDREFWYQRPDVNASGIAALRTLDGSMLLDVLAMAVECRAGMQSPEQLKALSRIRYFSYSRYTLKGRLPR